MDKLVPGNYFARMRAGEAPLPRVTSMLGGTIRHVDVEAGVLESDYVGADNFRNPAGQIQGGMLCSMLDDVTAMLVTAIVADGEFCSTLNLNVSFLRPGKPGLIRGRSSLTKRGRDVCYVAGELWQDDKLIATANATCMIARPAARGA